MWDQHFWHKPDQDTQSIFMTERKGGGSVIKCI